MDFSNFVKNFYRHATTQLKQFRNYYGKIVNVNRELGIAREDLHPEDSESLFLLAFVVYIDSPTNLFINFMDYYVSMMPDLGIVYANKQRMNDLYNNVVEMKFIEDDKATMDYIEFVVGVGIQTLVNQGILEK